MHSDVLLRAQRNKNAATLLEKQGWVSTGDVPYQFGRILGRSPGTIASHLAMVLQKLLDALGDEYRHEHVQKVGSRQFISPDCMHRLLAFVVEFAPVPRAATN